MEKLHDIGLLGIGAGGKGKLSDVEHKVTVSAFCRRRLGVVMTRLRMSETVSAANKFVEQGHVRVGTEVVTDPAFLVTRYVSVISRTFSMMRLTEFQEHGRFCDVGGLIQDQAEHHEIPRQTGRLRPIVILGMAVIIIGCPDMVMPIGR